MLSQLLAVASTPNLEPYNNQLQRMLARRLNISEFLNGQ